MLTVLVRILNEVVCFSGIRIVSVKCMGIPVSSVSRSVELARFCKL